MIEIMSWLSSIALDGVDHDIPGNGGPNCVAFLPLWQRIIETLLFTPLTLYSIYVSWPFLEWKNENLNKKIDNQCNSKDNSPISIILEQYKPTLLRVYSVIFCIELIYKILSKTGIYVLNPCHICTILQLTLLSMDKNDPKVTQLFRFQMYVMPGAVFALAFPILNTRLLPGEVIVYFVQHVFIILVPLYLMFLNGNYIPEDRQNMAWPLFSMSIIAFYHFLFLQPIAYLTSVNLSCILCPGVSDPLGNRLWRIAACIHQCSLIPIMSKSYSYYGQLFIQKYKIQENEIINAKQQ